MAFVLPRKEEGEYWDKLQKGVDWFARFHNARMLVVLACGARRYTATAVRPCRLRLMRPMKLWGAGQSLAAGPACCERWPGLTRAAHMLRSRAGPKITTLKVDWDKWKDEDELNGNDVSGIAIRFPPT